MALLWLWAILATVLSFVLAILWHVERNDLDSIFEQLNASCQRTKDERARALDMEAEIVSLEAKYSARCQELRDLRKQVSESILSLAESAKVE